MATTPEPCVDCLLTAIEQFHKELFAWIYKISDDQLADFEPLNAWGPVLDQCRAIDKKRHWPEPLKQH